LPQSNWGTDSHPESGKAGERGELCNQPLSPVCHSLPTLPREHLSNWR
jgi:hypothetical protein